MPAKHPRCELCAENPEAQPHCWIIKYDEDKDEHFGQCRHCPATAQLCDDCLGSGTLDLPDEDADACPTCEGWGVILPAKEPPA